jgi:hypothetical protein
MPRGLQSKVIFLLYRIGDSIMPPFLFWWQISYFRLRLRLQAVWHDDIRISKPVSNPRYSYLGFLPYLRTLYKNNKILYPCDTVALPADFRNFNIVFLA